MSKSRFAILVLLAACAVNGQGLIDGPSSNDGNEVAGWVVSAVTGERLRGAAVQLRPAGGRAGLGGVRRSTTTGVDGRFRFENLPPSSYVVTAAKTGYERRHRWGSRLELDLTGDSDTRDLHIELRPSAVVTGRVTDRLGDPLPNAGVSVYHRRHSRDGSFLAAVFGENTNDLGEYRVFGLGAGKYLLGVHPPKEEGPPGVVYFEHSHLFYPSTNTYRDAGRLRLGWGTEFGGADFKLDEAPRTRLEGTVKTEQPWGPCPGCGLTLDHESGFQIHPTLNEKGHFSVRGLPYGNYQVWAHHPSDSERVGYAEITIVDESVSGVEVVVTRPGTVGGRVRIVGEEDTSAGAEEKPIDFLAVTLGPLRPRPGSRYRGAMVTEQQTFRAGEVSPGRYRLQVGLRNASSQGFYLKSASVEGRALPTPHLTIRPYQNIGDLELVIAMDGAQVHGTVDPEAALELPEGIAILIPEMNTNPFAAHRYVAYQPDGSFTIRGVAPGAYTAYAVPGPRTFDFYDPDVARALAGLGQKLDLSEGAEAEIELTFIPEPDEPL